MKKSHSYILGLDLGTTSIGWSLISANPVPDSIIASGVRIFPEGMDRTKGEKSLNQDRRDARSLRRQGYRRQRRRAKLLHTLQDIGLLPEDGQKLDILFQEDPYELRSSSLIRKLDPWQLGRALYHLGQRRGFLSNRKTDRGSEDGKVKTAISELDQLISEAGFKTLGQYFNSLDPHQQRIRGRYTSRHQYQTEFNLICDAQEKHHPDLLDVANRKRIYDAIFEQRPLRIQKHLIGKCELEKDRKRAAKATLAAQEFRLWSDINHLKVLFADGEERYLTDEERLKLHNKLHVSRDLDWVKIKKELEFLENCQFNLEKVRKSGLLGNKTAWMLNNALGKKYWQSLGSRQQEQLVFDLLNIHSDEALKNRLRKHWRFDEEQIEKLMKKSLELPKGMVHLSNKALRNITKYLSEVSTKDNRGLTYDQACLKAGYKHTRDKSNKKLNRLPYYGIAAKDKKNKFFLHDPEVVNSEITIEGLRNPMVERAMFQLRRVINAIINQYGKPDIIRVEMARDLKSNRRQREDYSYRQRQNELANEKADEALREYGYPNPTRNDKLKYRLWQECSHTCPYTGKTINFDQLFGDHPQFDIEHIIPYSRCLDDSYMNKTLCENTFNAQVKGNLIPSEIFISSPDKFDQVKQRIANFPYPKRKRFIMDKNAKELTEKAFVSQQLNETRYISKLAIQYLEQLGIQVKPVKGGTTALLRKAWGLNNLLNQDGIKDRNDHRHHAVDALVCALTDEKAIQKISRYSSLSQGRMRVNNYPAPMDNLREAANPIINNIVVSHKPQRKVKGALHEETLYSLKAPLNKKGDQQIRIRKPISGLKEKDLHLIADNQIRAMALRHLEKNQGDIKKAFSQTPNTFGFNTTDKDGDAKFIPINKVRLQYPLNVRTIGEEQNRNNHEKFRSRKRKHNDHLRHVKLGSNHHIEFFETEYNGKPKWLGRVVPTLDASLRIKNRLPVIDKNMDNGKFIMALHINDCIEMTHNGEKNIYVLQKIAQSGQIHFRLHNDASEKKDMTLAVSKQPETLRKSAARKVSVNLLGKIMPADD